MANKMSNCKKSLKCLVTFQYGKLNVPADCIQFINKPTTTTETAIATTTATM